jgi:hypothetical protein
MGSARLEPRAARAGLRAARQALRALFAGRLGVTPDADGTWRSEGAGSISAVLGELPRGRRAVQ